MSENILFSCPWPEDIWTMTPERYVAAVPSRHLRTAISGYLMREAWKLMDFELRAALDRSGYDLSCCMDCGKPVFCIPDGQPMCEQCAKTEGE
jgi:hypothetical protein